MFYRVVELSTHAESGAPYLLVHFWKTKAAAVQGKPPYLINDFILGHITADREGLEVEVKGMLRDYWERAEKLEWKGDHSSAYPVTQADFSNGGRVVRPKDLPLARSSYRHGKDERGVLGKLSALQEES